MRLTNQEIEVIFDEQSSSITHLINKRTGDNYIKKQRSESLVECVALMKNTHQKLRLKLGDIERVTSLKNGYQVYYSSMYEEDRVFLIGVILKIAIEGQELSVQCEISNHTMDLDIVEIVCPNLKGVYLGAYYEDDVIIYPHHAGEKTINPIEAYASQRYQDFWRAQSVKEEDYYVREINYCGLASMTWMYYYDQQNGLYIASHDERFPVTGVRVESGGKENPWMGFSFRKHKRIRSGETWQSKEYCIAVTTKDWHWGGKRYRKWINQHLEIQQNPTFLEKEYALSQCYNFKKDGKIQYKFQDIPDMFHMGEDYGVRHMFIASWNRKGFDCNYPEYYPDMELGTAMDLRQGVEYVHEKGGFTTFYINARLFDLASDFYESIGSQMAIRNEKDEVLTETYGPVAFSLCCPSDEKWKKQLIDTALFAQRAYGAKGIYLDQLASAEPFPCYCPHHTHEDIGAFNEGYLEILKAIRTGLKAWDEDSYIMTENCGDIYGMYTWGNLTWNGTHYDEHFNVFKYTFPEYIQVNMVNPRSWVKDLKEKNEWFYKDIQRAILLGSVLWVGITTRIKEADETIKAYIRKVLKFREKIHSYIISQTYLDNRYIQQIDEELEASVWEDDEGISVIIGNLLGAKEREVVLQLPIKVKEEIVIDLEDKVSGRTLVYREQDVVTIKMTDQLLSYVYLKREVL